MRKKRTGDLETNLEPSILQELYPGETLEPWVKTTHLYDIGKELDERPLEKMVNLKVIKLDEC